MKKGKRITIKVSDDVYQRLKQCAYDTGWPMAYIVRAGLKHLLRVKGYLPKL